MAPVTTHVCAQLRHLVLYHLDNDLLDNALFMAERLFAVDPRSPDAVHLLALCYYRARHLKAAYDYSRSMALKGIHLGCAYIYAQACLALGRNREGELALDRCRPLWEGKVQRTKYSDIMKRYTPDAPAIWCLLGKLVQNRGDVKRAVDHYVDALRLNPFMWDAFERICETGATVRTASIFQSSLELLEFVAVPEIHNPVHEPGRAPLQTQVYNSIPMQNTPMGEVLKPTEDSGDMGGSLTHNLLAKMRMSIAPNHSSSHALSSRNTQHHATECSPSVSDDEAGLLNGRRYTSSNLEPPNAPLRKTRNLQALGFDLGPHANKAPPALPRIGIRGLSDGVESQNTSRNSNNKRTISGANPPQNVQTSMNGSSQQLQQRRSVRLLNSIRPTAGKVPSIPGQAGERDVGDGKRAKATGTRGRSTTTTSTVGRVVSGNRKPPEVDATVKEPRTVSSRIESAQEARISTGIQKDTGALQWLLELLVRLASGYLELKKFNCQGALHHLGSIPLQQRDTPWVLAQIGKAYYELSNYPEAEKVFSRISKMAPSRTKDTDIYSTVLWHLKHDTELAFLAHELVEAERTSPEAWCTIGNSFSLQRDYDQALKCFRRATQLDPKFAYGYTLQGHEHMANEEYEKALLEYRKAVGADHRHYNGWYGLGKVYEKLGKYDMAEKHYRAAANINPTNSILVLCIGVVLEKMNKQQQALAQYNYACQLAPLSSITRFKKARVLLHLQKPHEALKEFQILKDMAPEESNVHFMLGRVFKMLGDKASAIRHFTIALNLDPKAAQYIKEAMETLDDEDDDDGDTQMS